MLTLVFVILMFVVFGKLIGLAVRATWGITKVLFTIVFLPVILICMVVGGLISVALPILVVIGVLALIGAKS